MRRKGYRGFGRQNAENNSRKEIQALVIVVIQYLRCVGDDGQPRNPIGWIQEIDAKSHPQVQPRRFATRALVRGAGFSENIVKRHA
jgi:hypothetical protein